MIVSIAIVSVKGGDILTALCQALLSFTCIIALNPHTPVIDTYIIPVVDRKFRPRQVQSFAPGHIGKYPHHWSIQ